jgi:hypothetical protein
MTGAGGQSIRRNGSLRSEGTLLKNSYLISFSYYWQPLVSEAVKLALAK